MADPVRDFKLTDDGEWDSENGDLIRLGGADAVPQGIRIRLRMFAGECYLDDTLGRQWLEVILVKNPNRLLVREELREGITNTPDVTDAAGLDFQDLGNRQSLVSFVASTVYSDAKQADVVVSQ